MMIRFAVYLFIGTVLIGRGARAQPAAETLPQWQILRAVKDFGGRKAYAKANAALPPAPADRVVFIGDSITERGGKTFAGGSFLNRGVAGQSTAQMLVRFRQDVIDLKPAAVVIQGGLADIAGFTGPSSLGEIEDNLASMADLARAHGIVPILVGIPPAADYPGRTGPEPATQIIALNKWIADHCATSHFIYLDYHSALVGPNGQMKDGVSDDGVHPNEKGYAILNALAEKAVREALKTKAAKN